MRKKWFTRLRPPLPTGGRFLLAILFESCIGSSVLLASQISAQEEQNGQFTAGSEASPVLTIDDFRNLGGVHMGYEVDLSKSVRDCDTPIAATIAGSAWSISHCRYLVERELFALLIEPAEGNQAKSRFLVVEFGDFYHVQGAEEETSDTFNELAAMTDEQLNALFVEARAVRAP